MTMVPSQNFFNQQQQQQQRLYDGYGGFGDSYTERIGFMSSRPVGGYEFYSSDTCLASDLVVGPMAEDESRTSSVNEEAGSSSKDFQQDKDDRWLQLGLGGHITNPQLHDHQPSEPIPPRTGLLELDLLHGGASSSHQMKPLVPPFHLTDFRPPRPATNITTTPMFLQQPRTSNLSFPQHEVTWGYRPHSWNPSTAISSSSSSMSLGPYYHPRPFQHQGMGVAGPSSSSSMRVIDSPRRSHSNIWFMLQASPNQVKEPFLPQIPKSYLRIKDGRMTVRVLMKYLVSKLRLDSESEIEITCRGQQLVPYMTLQHVRDTIWNSRREIVTLLSDSSTTDHIMLLHYGRTVAS